MGFYGHLARYIKLQVAHAPGMLGMFSLKPRVSDPEMHHGTCATHVAWCMQVSLISGFLWSRWWGERSRHPWCMRNLPMPQWITPSWETSSHLRPLWKMVFPERFPCSSPTHLPILPPFQQLLSSCIGAANSLQIECGRSFQKSNATSIFCLISRTRRSKLVPAAVVGRTPS